MSKILGDVVDDNVLLEARLLIDNALKNIPQNTEPTADQYIDFADAFVNAIRATGNPFGITIARNNKSGMVDHSVLDFLDIIADDILTSGSNRPIDVYREIFALDDLSDSNLSGLSTERINKYSIVSQLDPSRIVSQLLIVRKFSDVVSIAKIIFGDH